MMLLWEQMLEPAKCVYRAMRSIVVQTRGFLRTHNMFRNANDRQLALYKNKHLGERCFLIGNGPSLTTEDLDRIANETSIACNMIYKIFDSTSWRPDYHCVTETRYAEKNAKEFTENIQKPFFTTRSCWKKMGCTPKATVYVDDLCKKEYSVHGNLLDYYTPGGSVMVFMLELAMYMGFQEIYLLGVDNTNSLRSGGHFTKGYENEDIIQANVARVKRILRAKDLTPEQTGDYQVRQARQAYQRIAEYAGAHGIKIFNATRNGALEVFPRVVLEDIVPDM